MTECTLHDGNSKLTYRNYKVAQQARRRMEEQYGFTFKVYRCNTCKRIHIGHRGGRARQALVVELGPRVMVALNKENDRNPSTRFRAVRNRARSKGNQWQPKPKTEKA